MSDSQVLCSIFGDLVDWDMNAMVASLAGVANLSAPAFLNAWTIVVEPLAAGLFSNVRDGSPDQCVRLDDVRTAVQRLMLETETPLTKGLMADAVLVAHVMPQSVLRGAVAAVALLVHHDLTDYIWATKTAFTDEYVALWLREVILRVAFLNGCRDRVLGSIMVSLDTFEQSPATTLTQGRMVYTPFKSAQPQKPFRLHPRASSDPLVSGFFKRCTGGLLDGILGQQQAGRIMVCGGLVVRAVSEDDTFFKSGDVDLFMVGFPDAEAATAAVVAAVSKMVAHAVSNIYNKFIILITDNACTLVFGIMIDGNEEIVKMQFILRLFQSEEEVLSNFDLGACCGMHDGDATRFTERARWSIEHGVHVAEPLQTSTATRAVKYDGRGFLYAVPVHANLRAALDMCLVDIASSQLDPDVAYRRGGLVQVVALASGKTKAHAEVVGEPMQAAGSMYQHFKDPGALVFNRGVFDDFSAHNTTVPAWRYETAVVGTLHEYTSPILTVRASDAAGMVEYFSKLLNSPLLHEGPKLDGLVGRWMVGAPAARLTWGSDDIFVNVSL